MTRLKEQIPPLYSSFLPDFIMDEIPEEKWTTCSNCTRCRMPRSPYVGTKCCNYYPYLANYLVGGILQDERPEMTKGKERIREVIFNKAGVTPYGIIPPKWYTNRRNKSLEDFKEWNIKNIGEIQQEARLLRCPYFDEGKCSIYDYRDAVCSTYFCTSVGGLNGDDYWKMTKNYLKMTENTLSSYALFQLTDSVSTFDTKQIKTIDFEIEKKDGSIDLESYKKIWRNWTGNEEQLYINCYNIVTSLDNKKFIELCGYNQVILAQGMQESLNTFINNLIPEYLILNPDLIMVQNSMSECTITLNGNSERINPVTYTILTKFNGKRTTTEILDQSFRILLNIGNLILHLIKKGMLIPIQSK